VQRLGKKLGRISVEELDQVVEGLNEIIGRVAHGRAQSNFNAASDAEYSRLEVCGRSRHASMTRCKS